MAAKVAASEGASADRLSLPAWAVGLFVTLAVTLSGATITLAFRAGAIADSLKHLAVAVEKVDGRMVRVEGALVQQGSRITTLEARSGLPSTVTSSASPLP